MLTAHTSYEVQTYCLVAAMQGNYSLALNECLHAYRHAPQEPLILLCMGVAMLNQVMHKKVPDRNRGVLQAFAFLQAGSSPMYLATCPAQSMNRTIVGAIFEGLPVHMPDVLLQHINPRSAWKGPCTSAIGALE